MPGDYTKALTVGDLLERLRDYDPATPILFNVEYANGDNWDTWEAELWETAELCPGYEGCQHTEPEMWYEVVMFVKKPERQKNAE